MVNYSILPRGSMSVNAKITTAIVIVLISLSGSVSAHNFCGDAQLVPLNNLISNKSKYLNQRVKTYAVLSTDAKEYTLLKQDEKSKLGILITSDAETDEYAKRMSLRPEKNTNVVDDLFEKLRAREGAEYKPDKTKIRYYRQDVMVCGRLVRSMGELRFAVDDMRIEKSYLLPWKNERKKNGNGLR